MSFDEREIFALERPEQSLLVYYALTSLLLGPFFFFYLVPMMFRFKTLRYRFDNEGVKMAWGILFRREINLTYARIQDIHLESNLIERWLGLARIKVQTASGSAKAEMTIEGLSNTDALREFLYTRMRGGSQAMASGTATEASTPGEAWAGGEASELAGTLRTIAEEVRALRQELGAQRGLTPRESTPRESTPQESTSQELGQPEASS